MSIEGCLACDLADGRRSLPGGVIHEADGWLVEHCVGPLGVGALVVKPRRHVTQVADLTDAEASPLGQLLVRTTRVVTQLVDPEQVYVTLWSHAGGVPVHIHFVVQPITTALRTAHGRMHGLPLQLAMFEAGVEPPANEVDALAERARELFAGS